VKEGDHVHLTCDAEGKPKPMFRFYKDESTAPLPKTELVDIDAKAGELYIHHASKSDEGTYRCEAYNDAGSTSSEATVFIISTYEAYMHIAA
jgi:hypothetical protein